MKPSAQAGFAGSFSERAPGPPVVHDELIAVSKRKASAAIGLCKRVMGTLQLCILQSLTAKVSDAKFRARGSTATAKRRQASHGMMNLYSPVGKRTGDGLSGAIIFMALGARSVQLDALSADR